MIYGRTEPLLPDTDGDGLPDGWNRAGGRRSTADADRH